MKYKKILTGLGLAGSLGTVATTATVITSCGTQKADLTLGMRAEEVQMWKPIISAFKDATGKTVKLTFVDNQQSDYERWSGSHTLPDLAITDAGSAKAGIDKKWFQPIDLEDIVTNSKWRINSAKYPESADLEFSDKDFNWGMIQSSKIEGTEKEYKNFPLVWGPQMPYVWNTIRDGSNEYQILPENDSGAPDLHWYVPSANGESTETVEKFNSCTGDTEQLKAESSPLCYLDDEGHVQHYKLNQKDIQEFFMNATLTSEIKHNGSYIISGGSLSGTKPEDRVISTGKFGYNQRLFSVAHELYQKVPKGWRDANKFALIGDPGIDYTGTMQGTAIFGSEGHHFGSDGKDTTSPLDDNKWSTIKGIDTATTEKFHTHKGDTLSADKMTALERLNYFGHLGYYRNGFLGTNDLMKKENSSAAFGTRNTLIMDGAKWQFNGVAKKAESIGAKISDISFFSKPFSENGIDGYAVSKDVSGEKLTLAKKFIRFLMQPNIAAMAAANKAVSTVRSATALQPVEGALGTAVKNSGFAYFNNIDKAAKEADSGAVAHQFIPGLQDSYAKRSTDNFYDRYNDLWINQRDDLGYDNAHGVTVADFLARISAKNAEYSEKADNAS